MGTFVEVKLIVPRDLNIKAKDIFDEVFNEAKRLEKKFSIFDAESEINALNIEKTRQVSDELFSLILEANRISSLTNGEFDITVAPILNKEGFYKDMPQEVRSLIPDDFSGVGGGNIKLDPATRTISLGENTWLDVCGIASGYIVDKMADLLRKKGITNFLIDDGGDIYCGEKPNNGTWRVGIRKPGANDVLATLSLRDMTVTTSGDYENVIASENKKEKRSHIIEPYSKRPLNEVPSSITVIAPTCTLADGLSTGMMAMGPSKALELANTLEGVAIVVVERLGDKFKVRYSDGALKYVIKE